MNKTALFLVSSLFVLATACGEGSGGSAGSAKPAGSAAATTKATNTPKSGDTGKPADTAKPAETAAAAVEASQEMKDFLAMFKGKSTDVEAALKKFGKAGLEDKDMGMYELKEPKVIKSETKDKQTCYDFEAGAGITVRTYGVCWEGGKIVAVEDKGMK